MHSASHRRPEYLNGRNPTHPSHPLQNVPPEDPPNMFVAAKRTGRLLCLTVSVRDLTRGRSWTLRRPCSVAYSREDGHGQKDAMVSFPRLSCFGLARLWTLVYFRYLDRPPTHPRQAAWTQKPRLHSSFPLSPTPPSRLTPPIHQFILPSHPRVPHTSTPLTCPLQGLPGAATERSTPAPGQHTRHALRPEVMRREDCSPGPKSSPVAGD